MPLWCRLIIYSVGQQTCLELLYDMMMKRDGGGGVLRAVSVELRNWKPIPMDSVTEDLSATVEQILGSLAAFVTVRIRLTRWVFTHHDSSCCGNSIFYSTQLKFIKPDSWTEIKTNTFKRRSRRVSVVKAPGGPGFDFPWYRRPESVSRWWR